MASSILNSDDGVISGTSGLKSTGGDDGVLVFQSKGTETAQINTDKQIVAAAGTASLPVLTTTGDLNTGIYFPAADNIGFATGGTIRGRWTTDGLCFGSDTAAANALDDYEEGTWTPTIQFGTANVAQTYLLQQGRYTKIGRMLYAYFAVEFSNKGASTGSARIIGLPFTSVNNNAGRAGGAVGYYDNLSSAGMVMLLVEQNATNSALRYATATASAALSDTNFANNSTIYGVYIYEAA